MYGVCLQGHAAGMSLASLRALHGQGRTHLAQYPGEYHSPAEPTEAAQGMLLAAAPRALYLPRPPVRRSSAAASGAPSSAPAGQSPACAGTPDAARLARSVADLTSAWTVAATTRPARAASSRETARARSALR